MDNPLAGFGGLRTALHFLPYSGKEYIRGECEMQKIECMRAAGHEEI
jgi:hypothetical protein